MNNAENLRRRLAARRGYAATIKTSPQGVTNFGLNTATAQLTPEAVA